MRIRSLPFAVLALLTACADNDLVGVHIALGKDGAGTLTARALQPTTAAGPAEAKAKGVQWSVRAALTSSQGAFQKIGEVSLGDGEVRFVTGNDGVPSLRVLLQRRPDLAWVAALTPDQTTRRSLAKVHDPSGKTREIGDTIRLEIQLPDAVIATGVQPPGRGIEVSHERNLARLLLPVASLQEKGDDLVWDISWK